MQARQSLRRRRPALALALLLAGLAAPLAAAPLAPPAPPKVVPVAPLPGPTGPPAAVRQPTARLQALRAERGLQYQEDAEPEGEGLLARLVRWLLRLLAAMQRTQGGRITWRVIFYSLFVGTLIFGVLKLLQLDVARVFGRVARAGGLGYEVGSENIHALDFAAAIAQAEASGNLRLAVRLGYLRLLKQLSDQALIDWQPDKTNQAYLRELATARPQLRPAFAELTQQFEYVWYGEWPLAPASYPALRDGQQQLGRNLSLVAG